MKWGWLPLKKLIDTLREDFSIIFERDPAARGWLEVVLCYPGLHAIYLYRLAHWLHQMGLPVLPRLISQTARWLTGIEIHPGAQIGKGIFIDHGMGVVIGETAILGDYVLLYQGVTLGGTGKESGKRHPTLGNNVVVGAGAKVLGNIEIGSNVRIGAGSVLLKNVPPDCTVVGIPGRIVHRDGAKVAPLEHNRAPDPEGDVIRSLISRVEQLERHVESNGLHQVSNYVIDSELLKYVRPRHLTPASHIEEIIDYDGFSDGAGI